MSKNTPMTLDMPPLDGDDLQDWHSRQLHGMGYTVLPRVLPETLLSDLRKAYDRVMEQYGGRASWRHQVETASGEPARQVHSLFELDPIFSELMDFAPSFTLAKSIIGEDITLLQSGLAHLLPAQCAAHCGWHRDGPNSNARCMYMLDDVEANGGAFTLIPGSHRWAERPPRYFDREKAEPRAIPGMTHITGPAGSCMVNYTWIWHTNSPNRSNRPRRIIMVTYKDAKSQQWNGDGHAQTVVCRALYDQQTTPTRRALCAGPWLRDEMLTRTQSLNPA